MKVFFSSFGFIFFTCLQNSSAKAPENFLWGAASAAFQVEGSPEDSDWREWTRISGKVAKNHNGEKATDFWNRYEEDFKIAKELGLNSYRLSIAWERIFPSKSQINQSAILKYKKIITKMREYNLEPVITLHHFVLPLWLVKTGGLLSPDFVTEFSSYAEILAKEFSPSPYNVKHWITFNEPNVLVHNGYLEGIWPPGKKGQIKNAVLATAQIIRAHVTAVNTMKGMNPSLQVSIAHHWRIFEAKNKWNPLDWIAAKITDKVWNDQIVNSMMTGKLNVWMPGGGRIKENLKLNQPPGLDYLGINYYGRALMSVSLKAPFVVASQGDLPKSDLDWEIYPEGLGMAAKQSYERFKIPVMITENGVADQKDLIRANFIKDHITSLKGAQNSGVAILGYFYWSLTDNFEWALGYDPRFGLVEIDYENRASRKLRPSAEVYKNLINNY
ncbi:MAG: glycoside hydrolase family 1 protein [Proteobacteria bacterium]|nr:glycoside hydrolase family 1 protein [Pseudomonadota bacterium]